MSKKLDFKYVANEALSAVQRILSHYLPGGKTKGNEYVVANPTRQDKKVGSFSINTETGVWSDFSTGDKGGDIISLIAYLDSSSQLAACKELSEFLGLDNQPPTPQKSTPPTKPKQEWVPVIPVPNEALNSCPKTNHMAGTPSFTWEYKDANDQLIMKVMRFEVIKDGERKKDFRPLVYAKCNETGRQAWQWKQSKENRPLYGLDELAKRPSDLILLVEGEKAADAAKQLFPAYVCMTWSGGSQALSKTDFTPLAGRTILLWPDNDNAGQKAMQQLSEILFKVGAGKVRFMDLAIFTFKPTYKAHRKPEFHKGAKWPNKADAHDALALGWSAAHFKEMEKLNRLFIEPDSKNTKTKRAKPSKFIVKNEGVFCRIPQDPNDDKPTQVIRICDRLDIVAQARDEHGMNWGVLVTFKDPDGIVKEWNIPRQLLATEGGARILQELYSRGLRAEPGPAPRRNLIDYLQTTGTEKRVKLVSKLGWFGKAFLLPGEVIGQPKEPLYFNNVGGGVSKIEQQGTLDEWQENVSKQCIDNHRLIFAICTAFAAPLLELTGSETAGFHFYGGSSQGKTTLLKLAASVYGSPDYVKTWRSTDNALEATAASHSDCLLILDEIGQCDARIIGESIYMLGNGKGKARANDRGGSNNNTAQWRLLFLSTGEKTLSEHLAEANKTIKAGMDMRLLAIPSDAEKELGVFDTVHDFSGGAALSSYLSEQTAKFHGAPFKAFIEKLIDGNLLSKLPGRIKDAKLEFAHSNLSNRASGQDSRAADKFALIGLAGELATHFGLTGWPKGAAKTASKVVFDSWLEHRGGEGNLEDRQIIQQVGLFFERYGESRFTRWDKEEPRVDEHVPRTDNRCGFRKTEVYLRNGRDESTETVYYVLPESFRAEICKGQNPRYVTKLLIELGVLERTAGGESSIPCRLPGYGKKRQRCYKIIPGNLSFDKQEVKEVGA